MPQGADFVTPPQREASPKEQTTGELVNRLTITFNLNGFNDS